MTQEEKQLLLKDLCARLPYGVKVTFQNNGFRWDWYQTLYEIKKCDDGDYSINGWGIHGIKPYLRPMSSMTQKEEEDLKQIIEIELNYLASGHVGHTVESAASSTFEIDFYNSHHFDFRGLMPMGLALEAPKDMYKTE